MQWGYEGGSWAGGGDRSPQAGRALPAGPKPCATPPLTAAASSSPPGPALSGYKRCASSPQGSTYPSFLRSTSMSQRQPVDAAPGRRVSPAQGE